MGTPNKRTREAADRATAAETISPLDVMLSTMRRLYADEEWDKAAEVASKAAPYMHSRLQTIDVNSTSEHVIYEISADPLTVDEWLAKHGKQS